MYATIYIHIYGVSKSNYKLTFDLLEHNSDIKVMCRQIDALQMFLLLLLRECWANKMRTKWSTS